MLVAKIVFPVPAGGHVKGKHPGCQGNMGFRMHFEGLIALLRFTEFIGFIGLAQGVQGL